MSVHNKLILNIQILGMLGIILCISLSACQKPPDEKIQIGGPNVVFDFKKIYPKGDFDLQNLCWEPNGKKVAALIQKYKTGSGEIWIIDIEGYKKLRILEWFYNNPISGLLQDLSWYPDGNKIIFVASRGWDDVSANNKESGIWSIDIDGSDLKPIIVFPGKYYDFSSVSCNPDGIKIAFIRFDNATATDQLCVLNMEENQVKVLQASNLFESHNKEAIVSFGGLSWAPDGKLIVFEVFYKEEKDYERGEFWIVNPDGSQLRKITNGSCPSWFYGSEQLLFYLYEDYWTIDIHGSNLRKLNFNLSGAPYFSPDGKKIALLKDQEIILANLLQEKKDNGKVNSIKHGY
jgi:Tol biopolymer transport system component